VLVPGRRELLAEGGPSRKVETKSETTQRADQRMKTHLKFVGLDVHPDTIVIAAADAARDGDRLFSVDSALVCPFSTSAEGSVPILGAFQPIRPRVPSPYSTDLCDRLSAYGSSATNWPARRALRPPVNGAAAKHLASAGAIHLR
jgi:hypothetical protein